MNKLHFKNLNKFIKYRRNYLGKYLPLKTSSVDEDLKFREDAEYNDLEQMLRRHNILERIDGLKTHSIDEEQKLVKKINNPADYLEHTMNIHLKDNN